MTTLLFVFSISFGTCLVLTPLIRTLASRYGLVDHPDGGRKMHAQGTPVAGGLAVLVSGALAILAGFQLPTALHDHLTQHADGLLGLFAAAVVICAVGVVDDFSVLRGRQKLLGQVVAVGLVMGSGLVVRTVRLFDWEVDLGLLAVPFTLFWLLGAINALNLLDGMDGLLSTVGLIITMAMAVMAVIGNHWASACVAVGLAGALLGFLRYNYPPASIFLGDSGSMLIGLVVGTLAIRSSLKGAATVALAAPLAVLTIPILDTVAAILRRKLTGRSIYTTDRGHLHHCLLRRGLSNERVLLWVACFCLLTVIGALASVALKSEMVALLSASAVIGILVATRLFGYAEFVLVRQRVASIAFSFLRRRANGEAHQTEVRLQGSADWRELWQAVTACAVQLDLQTVRLNVNAPALHEGYHARWDRLGEAEDETHLWRAEIPLTTPHGQTVGRLEVVGRQTQEPIWQQLATVARLVEDFEAPLPLPAARNGNGNGKTAAHDGPALPRAARPEKV